MFSPPACIRWVSLPFCEATEEREDRPSHPLRKVCSGILERHTKQDYRVRSYIYTRKLILYDSLMSTATVKLEKGHCTVHLPPEISVPEGEVSVRLDGKTLVLEPLKKEQWPADFFEAIHISDETFVRPPQPPMPPIKPVCDQRE